MDESAEEVAYRCGIERIKGSDSLASLQLASPFFPAGRASVSAQVRVGRLELFAIEERLTDRDRLILEHVGQLRLLCARQIQVLVFPDDGHASPATAARCCRRVLERLTRERLLSRLERRVGGARFGSASYVYALGPVGQRVLDADGPRRRLTEPSARFVAHTLSVAEFFVQLHLHVRAQGWQLLSWQSEPACWREVTTLGGRVVLRPDLFVVLGVGEYELRWFVEIDLGSEHLPTLLRKCRLYHSYYKSGREQHRYRVFPRVLWVMPNQSRAERLRATVDADRRLTAELFRIALTDAAPAVIGDGS